MLRGYAVENLVKGLWLQSGNSLSVNGKFQKIPGIKDHHLLELYKALERPPSPGRSDMLRSLTTAVLFLGRYPIPLNYQQYPVHSPTKDDPAASWSPCYEAEFWNMVGELGSAFEFMKALPSDSLDQVLQTWKTD